MQCARCVVIVSCSSVSLLTFDSRTIVSLLPEPLSHHAYISSRNQNQRKSKNRSRAWNDLVVYSLVTAVWGGSASAFIRDLSKDANSISLFLIAASVPDHASAASAASSAAAVAAADVIPAIVHRYDEGWSRFCVVPSGPSSNTRSTDQLWVASVLHLCNWYSVSGASTERHVIPSSIKSFLSSNVIIVGLSGFV